MTEITTIEQSCRALAENYPIYYGTKESIDGIEILRFGEKEKSIKDLCACDFDSILEAVGLNTLLIIVRNQNTKQLEFSSELYNDDWILVDAKFMKTLNKKEASSAGFMAAVEWLVNQEKE